MPLYEYQCVKCGNRFEVRQSIGADGTDLKCPECAAERPKKIISIFSSKNAVGRSSAGGSCAPSFSGRT
jgi:putative FmdB family regulatory protein